VVIVILRQIVFNQSSLIAQLTATSETCSPAPIVHSGLGTNLPGRRFDHLFFSAMAGLLFLTVFIGFAHSYYLAGIFARPCPV
jgi:hypothetical protein